MFTVKSQEGRVVGRYRSEPPKLAISDPELKAQLEDRRQRMGGVLVSPEGPVGWSPAVVVEYLRRCGYELVEEGDDGERDADPHVSPDSGRVQVRGVETAQRPGASSRVATVRP